MFGVKVREIEYGAFNMLRSLALGQLVELYYSPVSFIEIIAKTAREKEKRRNGPILGEIADTIKAVEEAEYMKPANPDPQAYSLAYKMRLLGHKDTINNILYATATTRNLAFLTIDQKLKEFIEKKNIKRATTMSHIELFKITSSR